ncbi:MAG: primase-helicase family protein, partial [Melioribacteraceae bacterium]
WVVKGQTKDYEKRSPLEKKEIKSKVLDFIGFVKDETAVTNILNSLAITLGEKATVIKKQLKDRKKDYSDELADHITNDPIVPFLDTNSNTRCYYDSIKDVLNFGVDKDFIRELMLDYGLIAPQEYPTFTVKFDPKDMGGKFDLYHKTFNLFTPTEYMFLEKNNTAIDLETSCQRIYSLLKNLIPVGVERNHFINWLSYIFATRNKVDTAWVFQGTQGSGKNLFFKSIIVPLFGKTQTIVIDDDRLQSDFNGYLKNKLFIAFNEVANDETKTRRSVKSKIKSLVSEESVIINEKHVKVFEMHNFANLLFFSNEALPLLVERQDRRFNIIETGRPLKELAVFKKNPKGFIEEIGKEIKQFAQYLMNYKYDESIVNDVIENETKNNIKELSMNKFELFATKLKENKWEWFEQFYPMQKRPSDLDFIKNQYLTEEELKSKKVEQGKMLRTYGLYGDYYSIDQGKLTRQLKMYDISKTRERRIESSTYYYVWE